MSALPRLNRTLTLERNENRVTANATLPKEQQSALRPVPTDDVWPPSTVLGILRNPRYAGYSTYTPKDDHVDGNRRRSWRASILRDEVNEPVRGQWEPIVEEYLWWTVQEILDDPKRATNRSGTMRRHRERLYLCGICDSPVRTHSARYRCPAHVMRSREQIDRFVLTAVRTRLESPDLQNLLHSQDEPRQRAVKMEMDEHRAKILRAQRDYDDENIEGRDLKRIREREEGSLTVLEAERILLATGSVASLVLGAKDPVWEFDNSDLGVQRSVVDALCEVRLYPHPRGVKTFNEDTVEIRWR